MTTDHPATRTPRTKRRRRPHPAATARTVAAGAAAVGTCALVAVFGMTAPETATSAPTATLQPGSDVGSAPATVDPYASGGATFRSPGPPSVGTAGRSAPATRSSSS